MATNLVSSVMQFLTPDLVAKIAQSLGIDPDVAGKGEGAWIFGAGRGSGGTCSSAAHEQDSPAAATCV